ncbi:MAG: peptidylprolyl isomerase [Myxococcota bacterium]
MGRAALPRRLRAGGAALALALLSCEDPAGEASLPPLVEVPQPATPRDVAVLDVEGFGEVRIELLADLAPVTAAHFAALARRDYYDGTTFHRVVPVFLVQGGDPLTRDRDPRNDGVGGGKERVADERPSLSLVRGIVALANTGVANSAGAQFFILVSDARHLDGHYAVFGRVSTGMDVVDRIALTPRDEYGRLGPVDRPLTNVVVTDVRIERAQPGADP